MLRSAATCVVLCFCTFGCFFAGANTVKGSGNTATEARTTGQFSKLRIDAGGDVQVTVGQPVSVSVTADDNILPLIETHVTGDELVIRPTKSISTRNPIRVTITVPSLSSVKINGSGDVTVTGVNSPTFAASISGSGSINAIGAAESVSGSIAGSGDLQLSGLASKSAAISISGSGSAQVHATESLQAGISGSGDIIYSGSPKQVQKNIGGSGSVRPR